MSSPVGTYAVGIGLAAARRMAAYTHTHAMVICENIERLVGTLSGPLQAARIGIAKKSEDGAAAN